MSSGITDKGKAEQVLSMEELLKEHLPQLAEVERLPKVALEEVMALSDQFPVAFPVHSARLKTLLKKGVQERAKLEEQVNSAYPLVHARVLPLLAAFLHYKRIYGRRKEKELYSSLTLLGLVNRLLKKRPVVFFNPNDTFVLRDGTDGCNGFEEIGHSHERPSLCLQEYMSYDEIKLSALVCVSSESCFVNPGGRHNRGVPGASGTYQSEGVIVGMVGTRFEREGVMEWQDCIVSPDQNTRDRGFGDDPPLKRWLVREWGRLWGAAPLPTWEQAQKAPDGSFISLSSRMLFNTQVYKARIQLSAETLLVEAGVRAAASGLKAYVHVVGLGLGCWLVTPQQHQLYVDAWAAALTAVDTSHIAHIDFSWIKVESCGGTSDGEVMPGTSVTVHFSERDMQAPVPSGTLLVATFAWDGNAMPGNEFWKGMLSASGDPAAACSSGAAELHNALINPRVTAHNLHVASSRGVEHVAEFARHLIKEGNADKCSGN
ncbi:uncharacterized protein LOC121873676 isoform X2 [Homarus americanus]|nr:uncharacterized protein LOC121873676 isoform X2 [Homarus americanus]XP_042233291.1 uncharacterized protein LOC121873676 isoform X2 [Homarus americanus]XP_042233293.1 uncharacterized protein LOC121873676 isoform X2 [Homarus americanus]